MMDYLVHIDTISMDFFCPFCMLKGCRSYFLYNDIFLSLKILIAFISEKSADPDEMSHYAAFILDLHCLPKSLFPGN